MNGSISTLTDVDYYSFTVAEGATISFNARARNLTGNSATELDPTIGLFNPSGQLVTTNDDSGTGSIWAAKIVHQANVAGLWRIAVSHYNDFSFTGQNTHNTGPGLSTGAYVLDVSASAQDLRPAIDTAHIVPSLARDLHLKHIFGGESLEVPVTINNDLATRFKGVVKVELFLSTTTDLSGSATGNRAVMTKMENLDLAGNGTKDLKITFTITPYLPGLVAGRDYYVVVKTTPVIGGDSNENNDVVASSESFRFVGTPKFLNLFTTTAYFNVIRETLRDDTAAAREQSANVNVSDLKSFVAAFEGDRTYAYLDTKSIPTIGVGINLNTISGTLKSDLAAAVRAYYLVNYPTENIAAKTDDQIIAMLRDQARRNLRKNVITAEDDASLFNTAIARFETTVDSLGLSLSTRQRIAMIDLTYNVGSPFGGVVAALREGDVVLAGFQLFDALRTSQGTGPLRRTRAEYANLLSGHKALLGNLV